jgi:hypothetical protein
MTGEVASIHGPFHAHGTLYLRAVPRSKVIENLRASPIAGRWHMPIRLIKHETMPKRGSFEEGGFQKGSHPSTCRRLGNR